MMLKNQKKIYCLMHFIFAKSEKRPQKIVFNKRGLKIPNGMLILTL